MKSPRRSTESLAVGARNGLATYDRLEGEQAKGSVYGVAVGVAVGVAEGDGLAGLAGAAPVGLGLGD
jgi:hypothetical protein